MERAIISLSAVFVKLAGVPAEVSALYRVFWGGLGLAVYTLARGRRLPPLTLAIVLAAAMFMTDLMCWHSSVGLVGPGLSTLLANFQVLILAMLSVLFLGEKLGGRMIAALPLGLAGVWCIVGPNWGDGGPGFRLGVGFGLGAAVVYALYLLFLKKSLKDRPPRDTSGVMAVVSLACAVMLGVLLAVKGVSPLVGDPVALGILVIYGLLPHALGWGLIAHGLNRVPASRAGLILLLQPTLSYVWDVLLFAKPLGGLEVAGVAMALVAIYLGAVRRAPAPGVSGAVPK